jgi:hypothetical protein
MAAVIHALWEGQDGSLLILPASVPLAEPTVQFVISKFLEDKWDSVLEGDVDGTNSLPLRLDREYANFGRYSACRRVARTVFLGSAPTFRMPNKGLEEKQVRLGSAQPGESVAIFNDALRRLTDQATHLYDDGRRRYWFSPQPSVTRLAQDRAGQQDPDAVADEIRRRLREEAGDTSRRGDFGRVHPAPGSSGDVPDDPVVRLVILGPESSHSPKQPDTLARRAAADILAHRGSSDRKYANAIVFLAADRTRLTELEQGVRQYLAWKSIVEDSEAEPPVLELDTAQQRQAKSKLDQADDTVRQRIPETYQWLLVPCQSATAEVNPTAPVERPAVDLQEIRVQGQDGLAVRASKKLRNDDLLIVTFGPTLLRMELDRIPLWRGDHVPVKQLAEDFARYLYLPRLRDAGVLRESIQKGLQPDNLYEQTFAYAEGFDSAKGRYLELKVREAVNVSLDGPGFLVRPEAATKQLQADQAKAEERTRTTTEPTTTTSAHDSSTSTPVSPGADSSMGGGVSVVQKTTILRRFHGAVRLDPARLGRDAGRIAEEVVQHLAGLVDAEVEVTLEVSVNLPEGVPEPIVRTVTENCRTLRFREYGFEES